MSESSIKVNIAGRNYNLTVEKKEEENVKKAARLIDQKIKEYSASFSFKDKQDLITMVALQFTTSFLNGEVQGDKDEIQTINLRLKELDKILDQHTGN
ncbi:MAG: cell division protein ZapA [Bacteroidota bacterium]